jgi:hypothetical protein
MPELPFVLSTTPFDSKKEFQVSLVPCCPQLLNTVRLTSLFDNSLTFALFFLIMRLLFFAAALPFISAYDLHVPTPDDEVIVVASTTNEHTPDAGKSIYSAPPVIKPGECMKPVVRREWRTLSNGDKKAWIDALKVPILLSI